MAEPVVYWYQTRNRVVASEYKPRLPGCGCDPYNRTTRRRAGTGPVRGDVRKRSGAVDLVKAFGGPLKRIAFVTRRSAK
jgi:hypothetical protein